MRAGLAPTRSLAQKSELLFGQSLYLPPLARACSSTSGLPGPVNVGLDDPVKHPNRLLLEQETNTSFRAFSLA